MKEIDDYFDCKRYGNGSEPSTYIDTENPMILNSFMSTLANQIINTFIHNKILNPEFAKTAVSRRKSSVFSNIVWMVGLKMRYSDFLWPDYTDSLYENGKWNNRNDSIYVPYGILPRGEYRYHFSMYENLNNRSITRWNARLKEEWEYKHIIITGVYIDHSTEPDFYDNPKLQINSALLQLTVEPVVSQPLPGYMTITFTHKRDKMVNPVCVYWQYINQDVAGKLPAAGYWSNYGMTMRRTNASMTVCRATHFGIFALLMEPKEPAAEKSTDWLGVIGILITLVSIITLLVFLVAMGMLKSYQTTNSRMYMCIAASLCLAQCFFLYSYTKRDDWETCNTMADFNALFYTAVMSWAMLEGVFHYSQVHHIFSQRTNISLFYHIIGWGFPLSVAVALLDYPYSKYDELRYCWPYLKGFEMAHFGGPLLILLFISITIKILTIISVKKHPEKIKELQFIQAIKSIKSSSVFTVTLSITWLIGTYGLHTAEIIQKIAFLLLASLHVVLAAEIFYFYFMKNEEVQDALVEQKKIKKNNRLRTYAHLDGVALEVNYVSNKDEGENQISNAGKSDC